MNAQSSFFYIASCAINCKEDLKVGFEDDNEKDGENDKCSDPDDEFEGLPLVDDGTIGKMIFVF